MKYVVEIENSLESLIPNFMNNRIKDLSMLEDLLKNKDFKQIAFEAHSFKGVTGSYGFFKAQELGIELEKAAFDQDSTKAASLLNELKEYFSNVEIVYVEDED